jgi:histidinol-phosphate aminotransferase
LTYLRDFARLVAMSFHSLANKYVCDIPVYEPGRPIEEVARELGLKPQTIIKLASNENALGPSPKALAAMRKALTTAHLYPDGGGFYLRQALAKKLGVEIDNIVLGTGSNEIIEFLYHAFVAPGDEVVAGDRAFVIYSIMAKSFQARCIEVPFKGHTHDLQAMREAITEKTKLVFVANPNNPTGTRVTNAELDAFIRSLPPHVIAVLDEAYIEFLDDPPPSIEWAIGISKSQAGTPVPPILKGGKPQAGTLRPSSGQAPVPPESCLAGEPKVVVLRTFSKIVGLAGLRIGYGIAQKECIALLQKVRQPFNVNSIAQAGALAALDDTAHIRKTKAMTRRGLAYLEKEFRRLKLEFVPSCANFILVNVGDGDRIFHALQRRGVIVRPMRGYKMPQWVRVTVGLPEENKKFSDALRAELSHK